MTCNSLVTKPSYQTIATTSLVYKGEAYSVRTGDGRGLSWGRVIHRAWTPVPGKVSASSDCRFARESSVDTIGGEKETIVSGVIDLVFLEE